MNHDRVGATISSTPKSCRKPPPREVDTGVVVLHRTTKIHTSMLCMIQALIYQTLLHSPIGSSSRINLSPCIRTRRGDWVWEEQLCFFFLKVAWKRRGKGIISGIECFIIYLLFLKFKYLMPYVIYLLDLRVGKVKFFLKKP